MSRVNTRHITTIFKQFSRKFSTNGRVRNLHCGKTLHVRAVVTSGDVIFRKRWFRRIERELIPSQPSFVSAERTTHTVCSEAERPFHGRILSTRPRQKTKTSKLSSTKKTAFSGTRAAPQKSACTVHITIVACKTFRNIGFFWALLTLEMLPAKYILVILIAKVRWQSFHREHILSFAWLNSQHQRKKWTDSKPTIIRYFCLTY